MGIFNEKHQEMSECMFVCVCQREREREREGGEWYFTINTGHCE